jgi:hypothetical protein
MEGAKVAEPGPPQGAGPRTHIGRWLRAVVLDGVPEMERLSRHLNGGRPGWNPDEPAVVEAACELAMRQTFGESPNAREITALVAHLRAIPLPAGAVAPGQLEMEAVVRAAMGDRSAIIDDIRPSVLLVIRDRLIVLASGQLGWSESDVDQLIADAEDLALRRGWHPPTADLSRSSSANSVPIAPTRIMFSRRRVVARVRCNAATCGAGPANATWRRCAGITTGASKPKGGSSPSRRPAR